MSHRPAPGRARQRAAQFRMDDSAEELLQERTVSFTVGTLFYKPKSRLIRDLGVLALAVMHNERQVPESAPLKVLDAMSGTGVRSLRYCLEAGGPTHVVSNELQFGDHPLASNLAPLVESGSCAVSNDDAVNLYMRAKLSGERFDLVDCDAFGTGMPHTAEAWWSVATGGLLYLCATDSCTTDGHNPHKAMAGYAAVAAKRFPASNEQGLRLFVGAAWREAAARNLHAAPIFSYFHAPSSSFRVMMRLEKPKRPPAAAYDSLAHVVRCKRCGQLASVPSDQLDQAAERLACGCGGAACAGGRSPKTVSGEQQQQQQQQQQHEEPKLEHTEASDAALGRDLQILGPLWVGPMHDAEYLARMAEEAGRREWEDAFALLETMKAEAEAEAGGALLYYHLGEVQRLLSARGLALPPLTDLIALLRAAGHTASHSHIERKAIKTSARLEELVAVVKGRVVS